MSSSDPRPPRQLAFLMPFKRQEREASVGKDDRQAAGMSKGRKDDSWRKLLLDRLERSGLTKLEK